jgi:hypothetical protein
MLMKMLTVSAAMLFLHGMISFGIMNDDTQPIALPAQHPANSHGPELLPEEDGEGAGGDTVTLRHAILRGSDFGLADAQIEDPGSEPPKHRTLPRAPMT